MRTLALGGLLVASAACGNIVQVFVPEAPVAPPPPPLEPGLLKTCNENLAAPPPQRVWMLTAPQLTSTMNAVYGDVTGGPAYDFVNASNLTYRGNRADLLRLNSAQVGLMLDRSASIGAFVSARVGSFVSCAPEETSCFEDFVRRLTLRAWRTPATADQVTRLRAVYDVGAEVSVDDGYRLVTTAILRSPRFLFRSEVGAPTGDGTIRLTPHELASRLSYLLWDSPPDDRLYALAADGTLPEEATLAAEVDRMLADPRARSLASRFMIQFTGASAITGITKAPSLGETFDLETTDALLQELRLFSESIAFEQRGTLSDMLLARETYANETVARFYGRTDVAGSAFASMTLPERRRGLLTQPVVLAVHSSMDHVVPTTRGRFLLEKLLCAPIGPPPAIPGDAPAAQPGLTPRERLEVMRDYPNCASCHDRADPLGFAFDGFNAIGKEVEGPVDESGAIVGSLISDGEFDNLSGLIERLADSEEVRACVNYHFFEFAEGRLATTADACRVLDAQNLFEDAGGNFHTLFRQTLSAPGGDIRRPNP